jgi:16S rRNA (guanine966-N2)-methyltransferase
VRIISGIFKGRILKALDNLPARPTTDFAKTGLFNMLNSRFKFEKLAVLDLFSGTGNISFEFISRKCKSLIAVEQDSNCVKFIRKTFDDLKAENADVIREDAFEFVKNHSHSYDIVFADPPFDMKNYDELVTLIFENKLVNTKGAFILEHQSKIHFTDHNNFIEERKFGNITFSFFSSLAGK